MSDFVQSHYAAIRTRRSINRQANIFRLIINVHNRTVTGDMLIEQFNQIIVRYPLIRVLIISGGFMLYRNQESHFFYPSTNTRLFDSPFIINLTQDGIQTVTNILSHFDENEYLQLMAQRFAENSDPSISILVVIEFRGFLNKTRQRTRKKRN